MSNFLSNDISVFPTAYRQYDDDGNTTIVNIESRLNTEYNITNLVNGLLDTRINSGNFVVDYDDTQHIIKFCLKGYYFEVNNLTNYINNEPLYVKIKILSFNQSNYNHLDELVPIDYAGGSRNLDKLIGTDTTPTFIGLEYSTNSDEATSDDDYFQLLDANGNVPEKSWLRFSTRQIGYYNGTNWVSIQTNFNTSNLQATTSFISPNILEDTSSNFKIKGVNNNNETSLGIIVNDNGKIVSNDQSYDFTATNDSYTFISSIKTSGTGKITNTGTKTIPTDTSDFTNDNNHLPTSKLVKTKLETETSARSSADATLQNNIDTVNEKINALDLSQVGVNGSYIKYISQDNGKVSATTQQFDTSISNNSNNAPTSNAVKVYVDTEIGKLDVSSVGSDGSYIKLISETDGKISATKQGFDINMDNPSNNNAPTTKNAKDYADTKISKNDLTFTYANGTLTITKTY